MNIKRFFLFFLMLAPLMLSAQDEDPWAIDTTEDNNATPFLVPDYGFLERVINDRSSNFYYPSLLKRFAAFDTTLTLEEVHCLYFGSVLQEGYDPYISLDEEDEARGILNQENLTKSDARRALSLLDKAIAKAPTHLRLYLYRHYANTVLHGEGSEEAEADAFHYVALISAIASSGDGSDYANAFHVAVVNHAYNVMNYYSLSPSSQSLQFDNGNSFDVYELEENEYDVEKLYFNITPCFSHLSKMFADKDSFDKPSTQLDLNVGTHCVVKLGKRVKDMGYVLNVVAHNQVSDTIDIVDGHSLLPEKGEKNTIHFYCVPTRDGKVVLLIKSFCKKTLNYDSYIRIVDRADFVSTSNSGMFPKVSMMEMWPDPIATIRICGVEPR